MRSFGTVAGIVVGIGVLIAANNGFQLWQSVQRFNSGLESYRSYLESGGVKSLDWELLQTSEGTFDGDRTFPERLREFEGGTVTLVGYGHPVDRGRFAPASLLPVSLTNLVFGANREYRFLTQLLLTPLPIEYYFGQNPPLNVSVLVKVGEGGPVTVESEVPAAFVGILELNEEAGKFFYVLRDARKLEN